MKTRFRQGIALVLLALYVPMVLLIGLLHSDQPAGQGKGNRVVQALEGSSSESKTEDGVCFACVFAAGHVPGTDEPPFLNVVRRFYLYCPPLSIPRAEFHPASARAPPAAILL